MELAQAQAQMPGPGDWVLPNRPKAQDLTPQSSKQAQDGNFLFLFSKKLRLK